MTTNLAGLKPLQLFSVMVLEGYGFQKNVYTFLEMKTAIQLETDAVSTETLTKVLNIFILEEYYLLGCDAV
jgi:hypothetical protein